MRLTTVGEDEKPASDFRFFLDLSLLTIYLLRPWPTGACYWLENPDNQGSAGQQESHSYHRIRDYSSSLTSSRRNFRAIWEVTLRCWGFLLENCTRIATSDKHPRRDKKSSTYHKSAHVQQHNRIIILMLRKSYETVVCVKDSGHSGEEKKTSFGLTSGGIQYNEFLFRYLHLYFHVTIKKMVAKNVRTLLLSRKVPSGDGPVLFDPSVWFTRGCLNKQ
jgi:hypothetical protein